MKKRFFKARSIFKAAPMCTSTLIELLFDDERKYFLQILPSMTNFMSISHFRVILLFNLSNQYSKVERRLLDTFKQNK